jgi:exosortase
MRQAARSLALDAAAVRAALPALALAAGWFALFGPVYADFADGPWRRDENAHALIVMAIVAGAIVARASTQSFAPARGRIEVLFGAAIGMFGAGLLFIGRLSETDLFLSASQCAVATGLVIALVGVDGARKLWFPLAMTLYLIIWPGWLLDTLTGPLKIFISRTVADGLYAAGLPVAHAGAVIAAGPYQLLVADACSGLNSLIALTAIGAVYLYAVKHGDWRVNAIVIALLVPIAILANLLRVCLLVLITYFLGYEAGQGFLHDGAGLFMFAIALGCVFLVDACALALFSRRCGRR